LIKSFDFKNESNSSIIKELCNSKDLFVYLIKYIFVYNNYEVYLGKEVPMSFNSIKNKISDGLLDWYINDNCIFIKENQSNNLIRLGIHSFSGLTMHIQESTYLPYMCIRINMHGIPTKEEGPNILITDIVMDGLQKNLKNIVNYINNNYTLLFLCTMYVNKNRVQFKDIELKSLNKDIRKLLKS